MIAMPAASFGLAVLALAVLVVAVALSSPRKLFAAEPIICEREAGRLWRGWD
jgi:hypothetical protein